MKHGKKCLHLEIIRHPYQPVRCIPKRLDKHRGSGCLLVGVCWIAQRVVATGTQTTKRDHIFLDEPRNLFIVRDIRIFPRGACKHNGFPCAIINMPSQGRADIHRPHRRDIVTVFSTSGRFLSVQTNAGFEHQFQPMTCDHQSGAKQYPPCVALCVVQNLGSFQKLLGEGGMLPGFGQEKTYDGGGPWMCRDKSMWRGRLGYGSPTSRHISLVQRRKRCERYNFIAPRRPASRTPSIDARHGSD